MDWSYVHFNALHWTTYLVDREAAIYKGQVPVEGVYQEHKDTQWTLSAQVRALSITLNYGVAIARKIITLPLRPGLL